RKVDFAVTDSFDANTEIALQCREQIFDLARLEIAPDASRTQRLVRDVDLDRRIAADLVNDLLERFAVEHQHPVSPVELADELSGLDRLDSPAAVQFDRGDFAGGQQGQGDPPLVVIAGRALELHVALFDGHLEARIVHADEELRAGDDDVAEIRLDDEGSRVVRGDVEVGFAPIEPDAAQRRAELDRHTTVRVQRDPRSLAGLDDLRFADAGLEGRVVFRRFDAARDDCEQQCDGESHAGYACGNREGNRPSACRAGRPRDDISQRGERIQALPDLRGSLELAHVRRMRTDPLA